MIASDLRPALLLTLAVAAVYAVSLNAPFVYDDHALAVDPVLRSASGWWRVWRLEQTRPLTWFTFWLNFQIGGGFHAVNLALHLAASLLLLYTAPRLIPRQPATIAAFVFALHPFAVEPAAYIFARATVLAAALCLAALALWLRGKLWWAVACFAVALLAKEEVAAFPVFLAVLHVAISRNHAERPPILAMLVLAGAAVLRVAVMTAVIPGSGAGPRAGISATQYFLTQGVVIPRYLLQVVWPAGLSADHLIRAPGLWGLLGWTALIAAVALALWFKRREGFWFLSGLILLLPTSSLFPAHDLAADRRMYLPMLAFSLLAGLLLARIPAAARVAVLLILGAVSFQRVLVWQSEESLWRDAVAKAPGKLEPALRLARAAQPSESLALLNALNQNDARVVAEQGSVYLRMDRPGEALSKFGRAAALEPANPAHYSNRGVALAKLGLRKEAEADWRHALSLDPCQPQARENLGVGPCPTSPGIRP